MLAISATVALAGCTSVSEQWHSWFGGESPSATPAAAVAATPSAPEREQVYYTGVDGLTVYASAGDTSKVVGRLTLYERVTRTRLERGYAYVTSAKSGLAGWVDNAKLVWRVPATANATPSASPAPAMPAAEAEPQGSAQPEEGTEPAAQEPTSTSTPATAEAPPTVEVPAAATVVPTPEIIAPTPVNAPTPAAKPAHPLPSIFDPY